jgi:hypothetical protein
MFRTSGLAVPPAQLLAAPFPLAKLGCNPQIVLNIYVRLSPKSHRFGATKGSGPARNLADCNAIKTCRPGRYEGDGI